MKHHRPTQMAAPRAQLWDTDLPSDGLRPAARSSRGFPNALALLPADLTLDDLRTSPDVVGVFLIEPGCAAEVLSGTALPAYLKARKPILIHASRARDLRPFLRRADAWRARGYWTEVLAP